ncbi:MAG: FtsX-like permease family protein, partial [Bacteroidota bacterium]
HDSHEGHDHDDHAGHDHEGHDHDEHDHEAEEQDAHAGHNHTPIKPLVEYTDKDITSLLLQFKSKTAIQSLNMARGINENTDLLAASPAIELNRLYDMMSVGEETLRILAIIIIFVSALSIFISLFSSLKDRKYELALMRVMGASRTKVFALIIMEGLLLAGLGYVIGILMSHVGMEIMGGALKDAFRYSFTGMLFLFDEIKLLGGALLIGLVAAIIPAIQASNTDISTTLASS